MIKKAKAFIKQKTIELCEICLPKSREFSRFFLFCFYLTLSGILSVSQPRILARVHIKDLTLPKKIPKSNYIKGFVCFL